MSGMTIKKPRFLALAVLVMGLIFGLVSFFFSVKAAAWAVLALILGLFGYFLYQIIQLVRAVLGLKKCADAFLSTITLDFVILPVKRRPKKVQPELPLQVGEYKALGFVPAGCYRLGPKEAPDLYAEGLAHPDLKIYAMVIAAESAKMVSSEVASFYADGASFTISASPADAFHSRPANMVTVRVDVSLRPAHLVKLLLEQRSSQGLLDTPPEEFQSTVEDEFRCLREWLEVQADECDDEDDDAGGEGGRGASY